MGYKAIQDIFSNKKTFYLHIFHHHKKHIKKRNSKEIIQKSSKCSHETDSDMYQKTCGASAGSCAEPENEKDPIIVRNQSEDKNLSKNIDCSDFDIIRAVQYGAYDRVLELIDAGYDVNRSDDDTVYLLHWAAINNRREIIKLLIEKGATVNVIGGDLQSTPLHWAVRQGHLAATVLLMKHGADPNLLDAEGSG